MLARFLLLVKCSLTPKREYGSLASSDDVLHNTNPHGEENMEPGMFDYEEWLDEVANKGLVDEQEECINESVECSINEHKYCTRVICKCTCHLRRSSNA